MVETEAEIEEVATGFRSVAIISFAIVISAHTICEYRVEEVDGNVGVDVMVMSVI